MAERSCRQCGCTDDDPCLIGPPQPEPDGLVVGYGFEYQTCSWAEWDLCSNCVDEPKPEGPPLLYGPRGERLL